MQKETRIYKFFVDVLTYEYCPDSMQTVSLVERILSQTSFLWQESDLMLYSEIKEMSQVLSDAKEFIEQLYSVEVMDTLLYRWNYGNLLSQLKQNARSKQVKAYFGL